MGNLVIGESIDQLTNSYSITRLLDYPMFSP